jgi:hypothetical protein
VLCTAAVSDSFTDLSSVQHQAAALLCFTSMLLSYCTRSIHNCFFLQAQGSDEPGSASTWALAFQDVMLRCMICR